MDKELTPAQKRVKKLLARDPDHFRKAGKKGGAASKTGGFKEVPGLAKRAIEKRWENERKKKASK